MSVAIICLVVLSFIFGFLFCKIFYSKSKTYDSTKIEDFCILKQESNVSRIVERKHPLYKHKLIVAREIFIDGKWRILDSLYSGQCASIERYIDHFDYSQKQKSLNNSFGVTKQFPC